MLFRRHRKERREDARAVAVEKPETGTAKQAAAPAARRRATRRLVNKDVIMDDVQGC